MSFLRMLPAAVLAMTLVGCLGDNDSSGPVANPDPPPLDCAAVLATEKSGLGGGAITYSPLFEAEDAVHNLIQKTEAEEGFADGTTSGIGLRMEKTGDLRVRWDGLSVAEAGLTEFVIIGASPWGTKFQDLTIYDDRGDVVFEDLDFAMFSSGDGPKLWAEYPVYAQLEAGTYALEIGDDWGFVFFDALKVRQQAVIRDSELNLSQVNYYKSAANHVEFRVDYNFNKLMAFEINGNPVNFEFHSSCAQPVLSNRDLAALPSGEHELRAIFNQGEDAVARLIVRENLSAPQNNRYEAEQQSIGTGVTIVDAGEQTGAYVEYDNFGTVEFLVQVPVAGKYAVNLSYRVGNSDAKRKLYVNGKRLRTAIGFRYTHQWDDSARWVIPLREGVNTITLSPDFGYLALDYLELSARPLQVAPQVHPKRHSVYLGAQIKPLRIKVDPVNQQLVSIVDQSGNTYAYTTRDSVINVDGEDVEILEDGFWVEIATADLGGLSAGAHQLTLQFDDGTEQAVTLDVVGENETRVAALTLTFFDVSHGLAVLMQMPDGTNIMADAGKHDMNEQRVRPFMIANKLPLHEIWTSHRHGDHWGGKGKLLEAYGDIPVDRLKDNQSLEITEDDGCTPQGDTPFARGDVFVYGEATVTVQNAHGDQCSGDYLDFNPNSLAFRLDYQGFSFGFQGDIYGQQQDENLEVWGEHAIKFDVLQSNHHWHGSISPEYVKKTGADLIIVSASEHVWGAGSFTQDGMEAVNYLRASNPEFMERLFTFDVGHIVVKVYDDGSWTYETVNRRSAGYVEDAANVMSYAQADLDDMVVGNFRGYAKEPRDFPITAVTVFSATGAEAIASGDIEIRNETTAYIKARRNDADNPSLTWVFDIAAAGAYEVRISYSSDNNERAQNIVVDGAGAERRVFPAEASVSARIYRFNAGRHRFEVNADWGYMEIHGIDIVAVD